MHALPRNEDIIDALASDFVQIASSLYASANAED